VTVTDASPRAFAPAVLVLGMVLLSVDQAAELARPVHAPGRHPVSGVKALLVVCHHETTTKTVSACEPTWPVFFDYKQNNSES
jgi:hypothetical protein